MAITRAQIARQLYRIGGVGGRAEEGSVERAGMSNRDQGREESMRDAQRRSDLRNLAKRQAEDKTFEQQGFERLRIRDSNFPGFISMGLNLLKNPRQKNLDRNIDFFRNDPRTRKAREKYGLTAQGYKNYMQDRMAGDIDAAGNLIMSTDDDNNNIILPIDTTFAQAPSITEQDDINQDGGLRLRFAAEGGIIDEETGRQMYGLGKLVKKATRAVKKVAKSPIGKAALAYTLTGGLGNLAQGQRFFTGFASPGTFLGGAGKIFSREGLRNILVGRPESILSPGGKDIFRQAATKGILGTGGKLSALKTITAASLLPLLGLGTGDESEDEAQRLLDEQGIDIAAIRANPDQYLAPRFAAEGGIMRQQYQEGSKEPVAKKTMPLLDMGGMEKDYRAEGGFVPIGRMEKADDVPARLSKNEFVFTADAVRNAGDGDVDKGAEVMYNMMKNLEAGGEVSEESQGLEGARKMFQTSQRLEEVL